MLLFFRDRIRIFIKTQVYLTFSILCLLLTGCATYYYADPFSNFTNVTPAKFKRVENPKPVYLIFEFKTSGVTNNQATESAKKQVTDLVKNSGLFSEISASQKKNEATLKIVINAESKGSGDLLLERVVFGFGDARITQEYTSLLTYSKDSEVLKISSGLNHMSTSTVRPTARKGHTELRAYNKEEEVEKMIREIVNNRLYELSINPNFK